MKKAIGLGLIVGVFFALFVLFQNYLGATAFYIAAVAMAMFAVLGPFGDFLKAAIAMLIGVVVGLASMIVLALFFPLPPDNLMFVAIVSGIALFLLVVLSVTGLRIDAMFLGWAACFAGLYPTYVADAASLATAALPAAIGVSVSLMVGLVMSLLVIKIAMTVNR
jgi:hypothetical protein